MATNHNQNNKISSQTIYRGAFGIGIAIILGAFGAHYIKDKLDLEHLHLFETAVRYQFYGCFGLLALGILLQNTNRNLNIPLYFLRFGILIFCGSLYFLALKPQFGIQGMNWMGAIAPFGGLGMVLAWIWVGIVFYKGSKTE
jgi:uncharacterized membrane protein YgdD (TMEM256/DUF423 family)